MIRLKKIVGYLFYNFFVGWLPHYQLGLKWPVSKKLREIAVKCFATECGSNVDIGRRVKLSASLKIGDRSSIGDFSYLQGKITIGKDVMMAPKCALIADNHQFNDVNKPMNTQGVVKKEIVIEDDVWIGYGVIILPGVVIGKGAVCAAGAVISNNVEPYSVVGGNPAKIIKMRK